jgi:hypothetical protein
MITHKIIVFKPRVTHFSNGWRAPNHTEAAFNAYIQAMPAFEEGEIVAYDWQFPPKPHSDLRSMHVVLKIKKEFDDKVYMGYATKPNYLFLMGLAGFNGDIRPNLFPPFSRWDDGHNIRKLLPEEIEMVGKHVLLQDYIKAAAFTITIR